MKRLKLLGAIALLGIPLAACDEGTEPPPVGSIVGQVSIEGTGIDGVSVNLSNGNSTTTSGGGNYRFDNVDGGAYTVTISGYPSDATFDATSAAATISSAGQSVTINFSGSYIRTASVMGSVTVENMGLGGVTVALSGVSSASTITDDNGQYAFTGLRQGSYSVEISGFDSDEVGFSNTSSAVTVGVGESKIVSFDGTYLRTAGIQGQVSVEGVGLEGVNVSLTGGPDGADMTTTTDAAGLYSFARLRAGDYAVGISGFDTDEYEFAVTSQNVTVALGETATLPFDGILLRTSGVAGRVSVGGMGLEGVTVTVSADGMDDVTAMTDATGQYAISALAAGDYTVTISGYDAVEYMFEDSQSVTLAMDQTAIVNFEGTALRSASLAVSVTADGEGVAGAAVTLTMITGATSGTVLGTQATDADGNAAFGPLLAGAYRVDIEVDSDEIDFESTTATVTVATAEMASASFAGTINRTASISGSVTVDGAGMGGVAVMLTGGEEDMSAETGDDGSYSFSGLRKGDYTVSITNPDENRYEFASTSESVSLAVGQAQSVSFAGSMTRSSSISGTVTVGGSGIPDVTVMLSGAASDSTMTDAAGGYAFTGLGAGTYTVAISGQDADAYVFETTSMDVMVGDNEAATANFWGTHARTASVSGMLFVDEAMKNDMYDEGEDAFTHAVPVILVGPGVDDRMPSASDETGAFSFTGLVKGTYQLVVAIPDGIDLGPYAYGGDPAGYTIELGVGEAKTQNLPFDITHQTVNFSVMLKSGEETGDALPGATVTLYADEEGEDKITDGMTGDDGMASIMFARDDADGPMAYAGVTAPDGFGVGGDMQMIEWNPQSPMSAASNSQDVVNLTAEVSFGGATVTTAMGGGNALAGWGIDVLMMGDDGMEAVEGDDIPEMLDAEGMGSFTMMAESAADLPMTYYVTFDADQEGEDAEGNELDGGESYETVDTVMYTHTGLSVDTEMDAGTVTARYTTQTLIVSVYREVDQVPGFTGNIGAGDVSSTTGVNLELRHATPSDRRSRIDPEVWKWEDRNVPGRTVWISKGVYTIRHLPADLKIFVVADPAEDNVEILLPDNLAAYEDPEENGIMGGAFGPEGGWGHTVSLCPLTKVDPTGQDFGECASFGFVHNYEVAGHVKKMIVEKDSDDGFKDERAINVPGIEVALTTVTGKNIAGENASIATLERAVRTGNERFPYTSIVDERQDLVFGRMAEGLYDVSVPDGWVATVNGDVVDEDFRLSADAVVPVEDLNDAIEDEDEDGPFHATDSVHIQVRPSTGTLYGIVTDEDGDPIEDVTVTVNGTSAETDIDGRYIVPDFERRASGTARIRNKLTITVSKDGYETQRDNPALPTNQRYQIGAEVGIDFAANDPTELDIELEESDLLATVTGMVTDEDGDPVSGVDITVTNADGVNALHNPTQLVTGAFCAAKRIEDTGLRADEDAGEGRGTGADRACFRTGDDGMYELEVVVTEDDEDYIITPSKDRTYFDDPVEEERLEVGDEEDGVDFEALDQGRLRGSVRNSDGDGVGGVTVTATVERDGGTYAPSASTNSRGRFTIWVDGDERYDVTATHADGYSFTQPDDADGVRIDPGETIDGLDFTAPTFAASGMKWTRDADTDGNYDDALTVSWTAGTVPAGYSVVNYQVQTNLVDDDPDTDWTNFGDPVESTTDPQVLDSEGGAPEGAFMVRIVSTATGTGVTTLRVTGAAETVAAIDPTANLTAAGRDAANEDELDLAWTANANTNSAFRVVVEVAVTETRKEWVVVGGNAFTATLTSMSRTATIALTTVEAWSTADGIGTIIVTAEMLAEDFRVAVESLQGTFDADDNPWKRSNVRSVPEK